MVRTHTNTCYSNFDDSSDVNTDSEIYSGSSHFARSNYTVKTIDDLRQHHLDSFSIRVAKAHETILSDRVPKRYNRLNIEMITVYQVFQIQDVYLCRVYGHVVIQILLAY